ncbi:MAG TPA: glycosyltransferase family 87 protein [Polyangiaceae bacterium]|nr:glycosyltransferase family 87 protein [Polyangiaceae bacterium]
MTSPSPRALRLVVVLVACAFLALWAAWWLDALSALRLRFAERTWMTAPAFGADFWSQSDFAARLWRGGVDPYENDRHLFHYPPIVIRLFLWTPYFSIATALRIWIVVLFLLVLAAVLLAYRVRERLRAGSVPFPALLALVLATFPMVYLFERANFDIVTLAGILLAVPLFETEDPRLEFLGGVLLAFGPWVKVYPGLLGLALVALRRHRALAGFVVGGVGIFLAMPAETLESFGVLRLAIERVSRGVAPDTYAVWSHSLSMAYLHAVASLGPSRLHELLARVPGAAVGLLAVLPLLGWVLLRVRRARSRDVLYPTLLWTVSVASFVPEIANDYSLLFLPLAAACVVGRGESRPTRALLALSAVSLQPFLLPIPGLVLLAAKVCAVVGVGTSLVGRAERSAAVQPPLGGGAGAGVSGIFATPSDHQ